MIRAPFPWGDDEEEEDDASDWMLEPKWGTLGRAQDRASDASRNDVLGKGNFSFPTVIIENRAKPKPKTLTPPK